MRQSEFFFVRRELKWWDYVLRCTKREEIEAKRQKQQEIVDAINANEEYTPSSWLLGGPTAKWGVILRVTGEFMTQYNMTLIKVVNLFLGHPSPAIMNNLKVGVAVCTHIDALDVRISSPAPIGDKLSPIAEGQEYPRVTISYSSHPGVL